MSAKVYINKIEKFLPKNIVSAHEIEHVFGEINTKTLKSSILTRFLFARILKSNVV